METGSENNTAKFKDLSVILFSQQNVITIKQDITQERYLMEMVAQKLNITPQQKR